MPTLTTLPPGVCNGSRMRCGSRPRKDAMAIIQTVGGAGCSDVASWLVAAIRSGNTVQRRGVVTPAQAAGGNTVGGRRELERWREIGQRPSLGDNPPTCNTRSTASSPPATKNRRRQQLPANIPVCGLNGAIFWQADMDRLRLETRKADPDFQRHDRRPRRPATTLRRQPGVVRLHGSAVYQGNRMQRLRRHRSSQHHRRDLLRHGVRPRDRPDPCRHRRLIAFAAADHRSVETTTR